VTVLTTGARAKGRGFLAGLLLGLSVAALVTLVLAFVFPPARFFPPRIEAGADLTPPAPTAPAAAPAPARAGSLLPPPALTPLVPNAPTVAMPAALPGLAPPAAPDVFDGGEAGSPSLFPQ
jgi:hypothetical protein